MPFRYLGLPRARFEPLFHMSDAELSSLNVRRMIVDEKPGFPCRISLEDAEPGERVLLLTFEHQPVDTPFRAAGPIFVRENADAAYDSKGIPPVFRSGRLLSARAYDAMGMMIDADVAAGDDVEKLLQGLFAQSKTEYVHLHYAKRGCFAARVERA
jgi:hypothetical protein